MDPLALEADLPPAARHVAHVLQERGPCTQPELVEITTLPETTVDDALARLALPLLIGQTQRARGVQLFGHPRRQFFETPKPTPRTNATRRRVPPTPRLADQRRRRRLEFNVKTYS